MPCSRWSSARVRTCSKPGASCSPVRATSSSGTRPCEAPTSAAGSTWPRQTPTSRRSRAHEGISPARRSRRLDRVCVRPRRNRHGAHLPHDRDHQLRAGFLRRPRRALHGRARRRHAWTARGFRRGRGRRVHRLARSPRRGRDAPRCAPAQPGPATDDRGPSARRVCGLAPRRRARGDRRARRRGRRVRRLGRTIGAGLGASDPCRPGQLRLGRPDRDQRLRRRRVRGPRQHPARVRRRADARHRPAAGRGLRGRDPGPRTAGTAIRARRRPRDHARPDRLACTARGARVRLGGRLPSLARLAATLAAGGVPVWLGYPLGPRGRPLFTPMGLYVVVAVGLFLLIGFAGQISLGQGAFYALGAYTAGILTVGVDPDERLVNPDAGIDPALAVLAAPLLTALVAAVIGVPLLRLRGHYLAFATLALHLILLAVIFAQSRFTGGQDPGLAVIEPLEIFGWQITGVTGGTPRHTAIVWGLVLVT